MKTLILTTAIILNILTIASKASVSNNTYRLCKNAYLYNRAVGNTYKKTLTKNSAVVRIREIRSRDYVVAEGIYGFINQGNYCD